MKLIGLIGGMSWENTIEYYRIINEMIKSELGGWNSAKILLYSVNFEEILTLQNKNRWNELAEIMITICKKMQLAGCSAVVICSNTMHKIADVIEHSISIPLIHVIDEVAKEILKKKITTIGLLGTKVTMDNGFYAKRLIEKAHVTVILPNNEEKEYINHTIYSEFSQGKFLTTTKQRFLQIIKRLEEKGANGIILGCTELPLLIKPDDVDIPLFDTLRIHLKAAVQFALS